MTHRLLLHDYIRVLVRFFLLSVSLIFSIHIAYGQKYLPPAGKTLLIIGQDLKSVYDYHASGFFPEPGGITSYMSLYDVANPDAYFPYGGLGEHPDGSPAPDIDWGAGPLNTRNAALGYPNSALSIGLYMTEEFFPGGLTQIANGVYDTEINRLAKFLKDIDKPVFLRIGYEFDGNWNIGYANSENFKNAYRHIVDVIRPQAPNTMMVLQACTSPVDDIIEGYHENIEDWYPGDDYVDYLGYSWFLSTPLQYSLTDEVLNLARTRHKPVMLCESAPQGYDLDALNYRYINTMLGGAPGSNPVSKTPDQIWDEWFKPFFDYIHDNSDVVRIVSYINADWDSQAKWAPPYNEGYWGDSRVEVNPDIRGKWLNEISSDFWLHGSDSLFALLSGEITLPETPVDPEEPTDPGTPPVVVEGFDIPDGKTLLMIGQTFTDEYMDYVEAMDKAPAGSSHYAELYSGTINQGDDASDEAFLDYIETYYPDAYAQLAISIKDNPGAGGYSGPDGVYQACLDIASGVWDAQIDAIAASMKSRPSIRFFVRICYEVSLNMFANKTTTEFIEILNKYTSMGINPLERADEIEEFDLMAYRNAYNYIAHRIRVVNQVENARFVFHPVRGINDAIHLYPGDDYVDYYAISLFNHDVCWPTWEGANPPFENCPASQEMDDNVRQSLNWARDVIKKPIIIAEAAAQSHLTAQADAAHINGYLDKLFNIIHTYDVKALVYINSNWSAHYWSDQWGDSRVQKESAVLSHWQNEVLKPRYIHYPETITSTAGSAKLYGVNVYPNPFDQTLFVECAESVHVQLIAPDGRIIFEQDMPAGGSLQPAVNPGLYMLKISKDDRVDTRLIIKR